jgi:hypothetical protein
MRAMRVKLAVSAVAAVVAAVVMYTVVTGANAGGRSAAAACRAPPAASVRGLDRTPRRATLVYDASYIHMQVDGLDPWVDAVAAHGARWSDFVADCPAVLRDSAAVAAGVPAAARPALAAIRRYSQEMWGERSMTRLLPALVRRSRVAGKPTWTFALVGPDSRTWRYAVVGDDDHVVAWQLTGSDAQRLFGTGPGGTGR